MNDQTLLDLQVELKKLQDSYSELMSKYVMIPEKEDNYKRAVHTYHDLRQGIEAITDLLNMRKMFRRTHQILDYLGIWTGMDDLLDDRLLYLLNGMAGYCDPTKTKPVLDKLNNDSKQTDTSNPNHA